MQKLNDKIYHAAIYLRLSQEDGDISVSDKNESNSISTQRDLIHAYLQKQADILYVTEFCDDGYTGTNFDRPGFNDMMKAVREKRVDCIVVKDLSRFGRDYIESGITIITKLCFIEYVCLFLQIGMNQITLGRDTVTLVFVRNRNVAIFLR